MSVVFRKVVAEDIEGIIDLCDECFGEENSLQYAKDTFLKSVDDPNQIYVVGVYNHEIVSHVKATVIPTIYSNIGTYAILNHICVKPSCRRMQVATRMLDYITELCLEMGCESLKLWSKNFRTDVHNCYYRYGFTSGDAGFFSKEIKKSVMENVI